MMGTCGTSAAIFLDSDVHFIHELPLALVANEALNFRSNVLMQYNCCEVI